MPLTTEQTSKLRIALEKRRSQLAAELRGDAARARAEPFGELAGEAPDRADESVAALIADTGQAELSRDLAEFRAVEAALARLAAERYGSCVDCGMDIDFARLLAGPAVSRCAACQERYEKTHRGAKKPSL